MTIFCPFLGIFPKSRHPPTPTPPWGGWGGYPPLGGVPPDFAKNPEKVVKKQGFLDPQKVVKNGQKTPKTPKTPKNTSPFFFVQISNEVPSFPYLQNTKTRF